VGKRLEVAIGGCPNITLKHLLHLHWRGAILFFVSQATNPDARIFRGNR
jgi:hypothetical protein